MIKSIDFLINILVHILIILTILTLFFWIFVSKKETRIVQNEFLKNIDSGFQGLKNKLDEEQKERVSQVVSDIEPGLKIFEKYFKRPDRGYLATNKCLKENNIRFIIYLIIFILGISLVYAYYCGGKIHIKNILKENLIIFAFIGVFEYIFFRQIADQFIPIKPSFLSNSIKDQVNKKFNL